MTKETAERTLRLSLLELPWGQARLLVRTEMRDLGLSQEDLAFELRMEGYRCTAKTVGRWLREDGTVPSFDALRGIIAALARNSAKGALLSQAAPAYVSPGPGPTLEHTPKYRPPRASGQAYRDTNRPKGLEPPPMRGHKHREAIPVPA